MSYGLELYTPTATPVADPDQETTLFIKSVSFNETFGECAPRTSNSHTDPWISGAFSSDPPPNTPFSILDVEIPHETHLDPNVEKDYIFANFYGYYFFDYIAYNRENAHLGNCDVLLEGVCHEGFPYYLSSLNIAYKVVGGKIYADITGHLHQYFGLSAARPPLMDWPTPVVGYEKKFDFRIDFYRGKPNG